MDVNIYISKLEEYIGKKIRYEIFDHEIRVYVDSEVYYDFDCSSMKVDMYERNIKTEIGIWKTEKVSKVNFAMLMRSVSKNVKDDVVPHEIEKCDSLDNLKFVFENYADNEFYSIGSAKTGKVSIILDNDYEILYSTNHRRYIIDKSSDKKYIFGRFYYEVTYYTSFMKNLRDYEAIFDETFSEEEIVNLIGY